MSVRIQTYHVVRCGDGHVQILRRRRSHRSVLVTTMTNLLRDPFLEFLATHDVNPVTMTEQDFWTWFWRFMTSP